MKWPQLSGWWHFWSLSKNVSLTDHWKWKWNLVASRWDSEIPWTVACPAPLSMEFSRQEYWSGLPFPSPRIFPTQGLNLGFLHCRQVLYQFFTAWEGIPTHRWQNEFQFINQKTQSCEQSKLLLVLPLDFSSLVGSPWWRTHGQTGGLWFVPSSCHSRLLALRGFFSLLSIWPWA